MAELMLVLSDDKSEFLDGHRYRRKKLPVVVETPLAPRTVPTAEENTGGGLATRGGSQNIGSRA